MTYALLAKMNEAEEAADRGAFSEAVRIQMAIQEENALGSPHAIQLIEDILRKAKHAWATKYEAQPQ